MPPVRFEPTISVLGRAKTGHSGLEIIMLCLHRALRKNRRGVDVRKVLERSE
jgi:hypothetical protein